MKKIRNVLLYILAIAILLAMFINIIIVNKHEEQLELFKSKIETVQKQIDSKLESIKVTNGINGYTPIKGIDYFDGKNGKDSISTNTIQTVIKETPVNGSDGKDGTNGLDGLTPELQCNTDKNRWEVRYGDDDGWQILNGRAVHCFVPDNNS